MQRSRTRSAWRRHRGIFAGSAWGILKGFFRKTKDPSMMTGLLLLLIVISSYISVAATLARTPRLAATEIAISSDI